MGGYPQEITKTSNSAYLSGSNTSYSWNSFSATDIVQEVVDRG